MGIEAKESKVQCDYNAGDSSVINVAGKGIHRGLLRSGHGLVLLNDKGEDRHEIRAVENGRHCCEEACDSGAPQRIEVN